MTHVIAGPETTSAPPSPAGIPGRGGPGSVGEVVALALPAVFSMLSVTAMWATDTFFVGRLGTAEQGAVGYAGTIAWTITSLVVGTLSTVQVFVAQHVGARSLAGAGHMTWQGVHLGLIAALPTAACALLAGPMLTAVGTDPGLLPHAIVYLRIRLFGAAGLFIAQAFQGYLRGTGDTRTPMFVTFAANGANILLDYLLIFGHLGLPRLEVAGAAIATVLALVLQAAILAAISIRRGLRAGHLERPFVPLSAPALAKLLRVGLPVGLQWLLDTGSWTVFTVIVARMGEIQAAAHQIAVAILHVSFMPGYGVSIAATTLVGQYLGAGNRAAALGAARNALGVGIAFMGAMGVLFLLARHDLVALFNPDPRVVAVGARLLVFAALFQIFDATNMVLSGVLRGAGDTRYPMVAGLVLSWAVFLPLLWLFCVRLDRGAAGGWLAAVVWLAGFALVLYHRFARRRWMDRVLVERAR